MKKIIYKILVAILCLNMFWGCNDWFDREPKNMITDDNVWNDPKLVLSLLANYYDRMPSLMGNFATGINTEFDDAMWSGHYDNNWHNNISSYANDYGRLWEYGLIRDINLALDNIKEYSVELSEAEKNQFTNELRFIRAYVYFDMVRRMGGVPLVTTQLVYNFDGDPTPLQVPRAKEHEIYDFIASEMDAIKDGLGNAGSQTRANKYTALALKSRAMLYAASLAKYNNLMATPSTLPGGEVGIPASMATGYYQQSLAASVEIITSGGYALYEKNPNKGANFYELFMDKSDNPEVIFAKDYLVSKDKRHYFAYDNIILSAREDNLSSSNIVPSLNLVESYDYLDGSPGTLKNKDNDGTYIAYAQPQDIFANKDARLYGTVVYPGTTFRGIDAQIQAGVAVWNGTSYTFDETGTLASVYTDGKVWVGSAGPKRDISEVGCTGFYLRKFVSDAAAASTRGTRADNWWPWFRLGEIYLNAAEAAFELGQADAKNYINTVREKHGGFAPNSIGTLTMDIIRNERRVELAFEDHRFYDLRRWRIAHELWNGDNTNPVCSLGALYPFRVIGGPDDGKYIFEKVNTIGMKGLLPRYFQLKNYYASIATAVRTNNPKIIQNPYF
jgi:hypothetical protein